MTPEELSQEAQRDISIADLIASQKFLTGEWYCIPHEGKLYTKYHTEIKGTVTAAGYVVHKTTWNQVKIHINLHRAIWIGAHGGIIPNPGMEIDHINGIKTDNRISNLRLCTPQENTYNPNTYKLRFKNRKAPLTDAQKETIREMYAAKTHTMQQLADMYLVSRQHISRILKEGAAAAC